MIATLAWACLALAALPLALALANLRVLRTPAPGPAPDGALVSILIPARDEAANIGPAVDAALATRGVPFELLVMDDGSTDGTADIVAERAACDPRLLLLRAPPLPPGWAGKAHACQRLSEQARGSHLLFVDADVRLGPDAASALLAHATATGATLVSGVPRQVMGSLGELATVPLVNLLLLGYLPMTQMRSSMRPELGAACGQLMLADAAGYAAGGGHAANPATRHDGLQLARHLRRRGFRTDLVRGARLARCRMYEGFDACWGGFLKNAREGMATPTALPLWTVLLVGGHVLPPLLLLVALAGGAPLLPTALATAASLGLRAVATAHGRESAWTIPLHPATVMVALAIQWAALLRLQPERAVAWKGRVYGAG